MTSLLSFDPFSEFRTMQRQMDNLMRRSLGGGAGWETPLITGPGTTGLEVGTLGGGGGELGIAEWRPLVDVRDTDKNLIIHAEVPGVNKEDIKLQVDNNRLIIQGEKKLKKTEEKENYVRKERFQGSFYRSLPLPEGVEPNQIQANFNNGVLEVIVPKPEQMLRKRMDIQIGTGEGAGTSQGPLKIGEKEQKGK